MADKKNIGLALGGGAALGPAHIGVLRALEKYHIKPQFIVGTSIGGVVGAMIAFGLSADTMEEKTKDLKWMDISGFSFAEGGMLSNEKLGEFVTKAVGKQKMEEAACEWAVVCTNIGNGQKVVLKKGDLKSAICATTGLPGVFIPTEIEGELLVDGGLVENVPVSTVRDMGADFVIGVDLNSQHQFQRPEGSMEVLLNSFHITMQTASKIQIDQAGLLIQPDLGNFSFVNLEQSEALIEEGYRAACAALEKAEFSSEV